MLIAINRPYFQGVKYSKKSRTPFFKKNQKMTRKIKKSQKIKNPPKK